MKKLKKTLCLFLALVMCLGMVNFTAFADEANPEGAPVEPESTDTIITDGDGGDDANIGGDNGGDDTIITDGNGDGDDDANITDGNGGDDTIITDGNGGDDTIITDGDGDGDDDTIITDGDGDDDANITDGNGGDDANITDGNGGDDANITDGNGSDDTTTTEGNGDGDDTGTTEPASVSLPAEVSQLRALLSEMEAFVLTEDNMEEFYELGMQVQALMEALEDVDYTGKEDDQVRFQMLADKLTGGGDTTAISISGYRWTVEVTVVDSKGNYKSTNQLTTKKFNGTSQNGTSYETVWKWTPNGNGYTVTALAETAVNAFIFMPFPGNLWDTSGYTYLGMGKNSCQTKAEYTKYNSAPNYSSFWWTPSKYATNRGVSIDFANKTGVICYIFRENTVTLTYDANGGAFADGKGMRSDDPKALTNGSATFNISSTIPTRENYTFKGWSNDSGTGQTVHYTHDGNPTSTKKQIAISQNKTIYAVWEKNPDQPTATPDLLTVKKTFVGLSKIPENFSIEWKEVHGTTGDVVTKTLTKGNVESIDGMTLTWKVPHFYSTGGGVHTATVTEHCDVTDYTYTTAASGTSWKVNGHTVTRNINDNVSGTTLNLTNTYTKNSGGNTTADYKVEWYDAATEELLDPSVLVGGSNPETRTGNVGETAGTTPADESADGYTFADEDERNVTEAEVKADGSTVLKLYFTKNPVGPGGETPEWTVNWMKGYGTAGEDPWDPDVPDTEPVKTETIQSETVPTVPTKDYPTDTTMQDMREDSKFIAWGGPVVDEEKHVITITAKWETTERTNTQFYKTFSGGDGLETKVQDNFEVKITITDLVTDELLAEGTLNKDNNLDQRIYFNYVVEHGYKITIVESNYEIAGYTFKSEATREEITEAAPTPAYSENPMISGSSGTHGIVNVYEKDNTLKPLTIGKTASEKEPYVDDQFYYTIKVENTNSKDIKVTITDKLDTKLDFVGATDGGDYDEDNRTVTWTNVTVPASGSKEVTLYVKANEAVKIDNTAVVTWESGSAEGTEDVTAKEKTPYTVSWYDAVTGQSIKDTDTRKGIPGDEVKVKGTQDPATEDYVVSGYTFKADDNRNVLSIDSLSAEDNDLKLYFTKDVTATSYTVEWRDAATGALISGKDPNPETRGGNVGEPAAVSEEDKVVYGYDFDADNSENVLSIEKLSATASENVLKLYFDRKVTTYTVVHEYYTNGSKDESLTVTESGNGNVGDVVTVTEGMKKPSAGGNTYAYSSATSESITLDESGNQVITLRYDRTVTTTDPGHDPNPGTDPEPPDDPDPEPEPEIPDPEVPKTEPDPEPEEPVVDVPDEQPPLVDLPDEQPPLVDLPDEQPPLVDWPDQQPPLTDLPVEWPPIVVADDPVPATDIPDEDVPMANVPQTGDYSLVWCVAAVVSVMGLAVLTLKKREDEEI